MLRRSIRNRTLVLVLGILLLSLSLISWRSYRDARHEIEELFDAQLAQSARLVQGLVMREMEPSARHALQSALDAAVNARRNQGVPGHDYETKLGFQVYAADGSSVLQSAGAPNGALQELAKAASASPFSNRVELSAVPFEDPYRNIPGGDTHPLPANPPYDAQYPGFGAFGVIVEATFKLAPAPTATRTLGVECESLTHAAEVAMGLWDLALPLRALTLLTPTAAEVAGLPRSAMVLLECFGNDAVLARRGEAVRQAAMAARSPRAGALPEIGRAHV